MSNEVKTIIEANKGANIFNTKEILRYKDLLYYMVLRDVTVLYKQTVLGFAWAIINPLFQIVIFSVVFGILAGVRPDHQGMPYPVFSCLAVIPWTYFSNSLSSAGGSLITASSVFTKVYFPRIIIPFTPILSKLFDFFISLIILIGVMIFYRYMPGSNIVYLLIPFTLIIITSAGLGLWFSSLSVQFRDFKFALSFMLPLLMYIAPVTFPASLVYKKLGQAAYHVYALYPMVGGIEGFRACFTNHQTMPWSIILISYLSAITILLTGAIYFKKTERYFADVA